MKKFDHEPTMEELFALLPDEVEMPDFIPPIKIPFIKKVIERKIKVAMSEALANLLFQ